MAGVEQIKVLDGEATPGSDITFFDWPVGPARRGTHSVVRTGFRVDGNSLGWWRDHLRAKGVKAGDVTDLGGRQGLVFEDPEGQRLSLVDNGPVTATRPWERSTVPAENQILGLGPIMMSVRDLAPRQGQREPRERLARPRQLSFAPRRLRVPRHVRGFSRVVDDERSFPMP